MSCTQTEREALLFTGSSIDPNVTPPAPTHPGLTQQAKGNLLFGGGAGDRQAVGTFINEKGQVVGWDEAGNQFVMQDSTSTPVSTFTDDRGRTIGVMGDGSHVLQTNKDGTSPYERASASTKAVIDKHDATGDTNMDDIWNWRQDVIL